MSGVYIVASGYSQAQGEDILLLRLSPEGEMQACHGLRVGDNPSCMAFGQGTLYVGSEVEDYARIRRYRVTADGFELLGEIEVPGSGLCHITFAYGAIWGSCYGSGSFFAADPALEKVLWRYDPPEDGRKHRAHWMAANGPWLYGVDLGADRLLRWPEGILQGRDDISPEGPLKILPELLPEMLPLAAGSGPRQILWQTPEAGWVVHELKAAVSPVFVRETEWAGGREAPLAPEENFPAGACLSKAGVLYVPVRGRDTLAALQACPEGARPLWEEKLPGSWPRFCALVAEERFLLVCLQKSHRLCCFIPETTGLRPVSDIPLGGAAYALQLPALDEAPARFEH